MIWNIRAANTTKRCPHVKKLLCTLNVHDAWIKCKVLEIVNCLFIYCQAKTARPVCTYM